MESVDYEIVRRNIIDFKDGYSDNLRRTHTKMIINASRGDIKAKRYLKECIRQELIRNDFKYKDPDIANPIITDIYSKYWGLGILEKYDSEDVDELMINGTRISIEKGGQIIDLPERFESEEEAIRIIRRVLEFDDTLDISKKNPVKNAERKDGSRITVAIPPMAKTPYLNIRKFDSFIPTTENLVASGTVSKRMLDVIDLLIKGKANISIIGEMGSGKTSFTNWAIGRLPLGERVGTLETSFELKTEMYPNLYFVQLREQPHLNKGTLGDLFQLLLRQNVKRILLGEMRSGYEVFQYIYACTRGHSGSFGTSHNMNAEGMLDDYAAMMLEDGLGTDKETNKRRVAGAIDVVFKFRKLKSGKRICSSIEEIVKTDDSYEISPLFVYEFYENNSSEGEHLEVNKISRGLINKMNDYGMEMSEIEKVLNYDD